VALDVLARGELEVVGRLVEASNATLLTRARLVGIEAYCVYKPISGERPLWDFPGRTLSRREVAAYLVSAAAGWQVVPPTVLRDGPFGLGSVQWWVGQDGSGLVDVVPPDRVPPGWLHVLDAESYDGSPVALVHADDPDLQRVAVFDIVTANADRKGGHLLRQQHLVRGVDHGLTFHTDDKLRTVLWGWAGQRLPDPLVDDLAALAQALDRPALAESLAELLDEDELVTLRRRVQQLQRRGRFPRPGPGRPAIPWPAL
jgi:uncharacterized repeat protein (TIGR03843 family)